METNKSVLFESLHKEYFPMVLQMCLGFSQGDRDKANDLTQEIFLKIWKHLESFRGQSSYKTWIYRITVNTCLQLIRQEKKKSSLPLEVVQHQLTTEPSMDLTDESMQLYTAIGKLNKIDRLIIMMVLEGHEYEDIAEVLGLQPTNLRVKIHRIKKRLKKILSHE